MLALKSLAYAPLLRISHGCSEFMNEVPVGELENRYHQTSAVPGFKNPSTLTGLSPELARGFS